MSTVIESTPADIVIARFQGVRPVARICKVSPSWVCRWKKPRSEGGRDGRVPDKYHYQLLGATKNRNIPQDRTVRLTARELIRGARV